MTQQNFELPPKSGKIYGKDGKVYWIAELLQNAGGGSYNNQKVADLLQEGSNVTLTFDKQAGTLTVAATDKNTQLSDSQVESIIKGYLKAGNNVSINNGTISATDKDTHLSDSQVESIIQSFLKAGNNVSISNGTISATDTNTQLSDAQVANAIATKSEIAALDPASATTQDIVNALQA